MPSLSRLFFTGFLKKFTVPALAGDWVTDFVVGFFANSVSFEVHSVYAHLVNFPRLWDSSVQRLPLAYCQGFPFLRSESSPDTKLTLVVG